MKDFDFACRTRILFGKNTQEKVGELCKEYDMNPILLVYGGGSIKRSGLYDEIVQNLCKSAINFFELGGISPNPNLKTVIKGRDICRQNNIKGILAVGGGSVIDTSKSIANAFYYDGDPFDFNLKKAIPQKALPVGVVLTISSAGSESSTSCVISNYDSNVKQGFNSPTNRPVFAIENPELTYNVPPYQVGAGIADIMMHSIERYFGPSDDNQLSDAWALALCKNVMTAGKKCLANPHDYDAKAQMMIDSSLSHNGLTGLGKDTAMVVHALEHALSGYRPDITHGAGIAVCYLGWSRLVALEAKEKFARLARTLFDIVEPDDPKAAIMGISAMESFYREIGMPTKLSDVGIYEEDLPNLVRLASDNGTRVIGLAPRSLNESDMLKAYRLCL